MKNWLNGTLLIATGILLAGLIWLIAAPPRGQAITLRPPPTPAPITVHVTGAVTSPGVYALPQDARVRDAIDVAGGLLEDANPTGLNLAAKLSDGAQITVAEIAPTGQPAPTNAAVPASSVTTATPIPVATAATAPGELININTATVEELDTLPGIGPAIAQRIIDYRTENGDFATIEDITNVSGIGPATFSNIESLITVAP